MICSWFGDLASTSVCETEINLSLCKFQGDIELQCRSNGTVALVVLKKDAEASGPAPHLNNGFVEERDTDGDTTDTGSSANHLNEKAETAQQKAKTSGRLMDSPQVSSPNMWQTFNCI